MKQRILISVMFLMGFAAVASAQMPAVLLKDINGRNVSTDTLNNCGKPMLISFFATWCKPCNRELSAINDVYDEWQESTGVKLVAVSIDQAQNINKVKPLVDQNGWQFETVLLDPNGELKRALGVQMIPFTLLLDGSGNIVYKHNGYTDGEEDELFEKIKELIKE